MGYEFKEVNSGKGGRREGAGRPPGRLSDITLIARAVMEERGYNPIEALMDIAEDEENSIKIRVDAHKELAKYYAPQLKAMDINANVKSGISINVVNFSKKISLAQGVTSEEGAQIGARKHNFIETPEDSLIPVIQQVDTEELIKQAVDEAIEQEFSGDDGDNSPIQLDT